MRYNKPRRNRYRSGDRDFRRNGSQDFNSRASVINSASKSFQRRSFSRNGFKAEKLLEKYNSLAKEALSNGDKILSESYYQYADHFLRVIDNRKSTQNNSKPNLSNSSMEKNSDEKVILEDEKNSDEKVILEDEKNSSSQQQQNNEEI